jgi:hypothetical protein
MAGDLRQAADTTVHLYDGDQLISKVAPTTTKTIARFKVRKPEAHDGSSSRTCHPCPETDPLHVCLDDRLCHIAALLAGRSVLGAPPSMLGGLRVRPGSAPN